MRWLALNLIYLIRWIWEFDLNQVELFWCLAALAAAAAGLRLEAATHLFASLAQKRRLAVASVGLAALAMRVLVLPVLPVPNPLITDEFSHLLLADTLASGRLTNPAHPQWRHFETIHVIQNPTYASMYLPGQAMFLALGKLAFGHPWWGVWLSNGLMCAALCWMLQQWVPPAWALFGGSVAVLRFSVFSYWNDSYWGGAVPALGGALVTGAVALIIKRPSFLNGLVFGTGAVILLYSRPFEGGALCLAGLFLCRRQLLSNATLAATILLLVGAGTLSYYCFRVTGNPLTLPYQVNQRTYGWPMTLLWDRPRGTSTHVRQLLQYYDWELSQHNRFVMDSLVEKFQFFWGFFLGPCLTLPLLFIRRDATTRPVFLMAAAVVAAVLVEQTGYPHYFSPVTGALLILVVQGAHHMHQSRRGLAFTRMVPLILLATLSVHALGGSLGLEYFTLARRLSWCCQARESSARADLRQRLEALPGRHLVIVHYGEKHSFDREWVYNAADIDAAKIVWARDLGAANNACLKSYYSGLRVWEVRADQ